MKNKIQLNSLHVFIIIIVASVLLYFPSLFNQFTLDDYPLILDNRYVKSLSQLIHSFNNVKDFDNELGIFRPVSYTLRTILYSIYTDKAIFYHATNIVLFAINCFLVYLIIRRLDPREEVAALTTLLFLIHPIHTHSINHLLGQEMLFCGLMAMTSVINFIDYLSSRKIQKLIVSVIFYILALLTQEAAIVIPILYLGVGLFAFKKTLKQAISQVVIFFLITGGFIYLRTAIFSKSTATQINQLAGVFSIEGVLNHFFSFAQLYGWYLTKILWPFDIVFLMNTNGLNNFRGIYGAVAVVLMTIIIFILLSKRHPLTKMAGWWILSGSLYGLLLTNIYSSAMGYVIETHWVYFSSIGIFWFLSSICISISLTWPKILKRIIVCGIVVFYSMIAVSYIPIYYDTRTYCAYWLKRVPHNPYAFVYLSQFYKYENDIERRIANLKNVLKYGGNERISIQLAEVYERLGQERELIETLSKALKYFPNSVSLNNWLGMIYFNNKNYDKALGYFEKAVLAKPYEIEPYENLANYYLLRQDYDDGLKALIPAIELVKDGDKKKVLMAKKIICLEGLNRQEDLSVSLHQFFGLKPSMKDIQGFIKLCRALNRTHLAEIVEDLKEKNERVRH